MRYVSVSLLVAFAALGAGASESPKLTDVHREELASFLAVLHAEHRLTKVKIAGWGSVGPLPSVKLWLGPEEAPAWMGLDARDGTVYYYLREEKKYLGEDADEPMATRTKAEAAFAAALPVLKYFSQPSDVSEYEISPERGRRETVAEGFWRIERLLTYQGYESFPSMISILVGAQDCQITEVVYSPPVPPADVPETVSREKAVELARIALLRDREENKLPTRELVFGDPASFQRATVMPSRYKYLSPEERPCFSRWCWKVTYSSEVWRRDSKSWEAVEWRRFVDIETGEVY